MTELSLYKFITENDIEWHRHENNRKPDVIILPYTFHLQEFEKLIEYYDTDEGLEMHLKNGYVAIWMNDLCNYFGIDIDKVFVGNP